MGRETDASGAGFGIKQLFNLFPAHVAVIADDLFDHLAGKSLSRSAEDGASVFPRVGFVPTDGC